VHELKDVALAQKIQSLLEENQRLSAFPIKVTAHEGTVYLSGKVHSQENRMEAELLASGATGVRQVVNQLMPDLDL